MALIGLHAPALASPATQAQSCGGMVPTITGTAQKDVLRGTAGNDVIAGLGGNDRIDGGAGDDVLCGDVGADTLAGGAGNDQLYGGDNGMVPLFESEPVAQGDRLVPGPGDDVVDVGINTVLDDEFYPYFPYDSIDLSAAATAVQVDLVAGTAIGEGADRLVLDLAAPTVGYAVEVLGSSYDDVLAGSDLPDILVGNDGADSVSGRRGDDLLLDHWDESSADDADTFDGGQGRDSLDAGYGLDTLLGGPGHDHIEEPSGVASLDAGAGRDAVQTTLSRGSGLITGGQGKDTWHVSVGYFSGKRRAVGGTVDLDRGRVVVRQRDRQRWQVPVTGFERLSLGSEGDWRFLGSAAAETVRSTIGLLRAWGRGGDDRLVGTSGDDVLIGGAGRDEVDGSAGRDRCRAEIERDCER